jgi:hypothetical protein
MEKMVSGFAITGRAREEPAAGAMDEMDDAKMEAAMETMEREFGSVADSDNPDPRALAAMMRRMGEITGQKMPAEMNEVIARLEKGEDPDKLEEEYGDVFEKMDQLGGEEGESGGAADERAKRRRRRPITRDPKLYEMSEFVDEA